MNSLPRSDGAPASSTADRAHSLQQCGRHDRIRGHADIDAARGQCTRQPDFGGGSLAQSGAQYGDQGRPIDPPIRRVESFAITLAAFCAVMDRDASDRREQSASRRRSGGLRQEQAELIVVIGGTDPAFAQKIHARHIYRTHDIKWNHRLLDILSTQPDGGRIVDYRRFHDVEPATRR